MGAPLSPGHMFARPHRPCGPRLETPRLTTGLRISMSPRLSSALGLAPQPHPSHTQ